MAGVAPPAAVAPDPAAEREPQLEILGVAKHFGGVKALDDVWLEVAGGTVHALVGENGAGKSTLGRIVAGALVADSGQILLAGVPVSFRSPREALEHRVAAIAQEPFVVPQLTVAENVFLGREPRSMGVLRRRRLTRAYASLAASAGFELPGALPAGRLRTAEQQQIEILRALSRDTELIVMDEPTAALSAHETDRLHGIIRSLAGAGTTIILISHFLREVLELADTVTVLRDGRVIRTSPASAETESSLVEAMLGRSLTATFPPRSPVRAAGPVVLSVQGLRAPGVEEVSFDLHAGEILGIAGLVGAGRTELARAVFGASRHEAGTVVLVDGLRGARSPRRSLDAGLAMIPESRKDDGLILGRSAIDNAALSRLEALSTLGVVRRTAERRGARAMLERCGVRGARYSAAVRTLSGGNQQKVLFARTLFCEPQVLIADEPTRGVDVGAKRAIYDLLVELAGAGLGVLMISSELDEILGLSHRVLVMRRGRIVAELSDDELTESRILAAAFEDDTDAGTSV